MRADRRPLQALTLACPWGPAIAFWNKGIENREWTPPDTLLGQPLAIHAGKFPEGKATRAVLEAKAAAIDLVERGLAPVGLTTETLQEFSSAILCIVIVAGWIDERGGSRAGPSDADRLAVRRALSVPGPYFVGPIGWVLRDVVTIRPVPCKGAQRLWTVPAALLPTLRERWSNARGMECAS